LLPQSPEIHDAARNLPNCYNHRVHNGQYE